MLLCRKDELLLALHLLMKITKTNMMHLWIANFHKKFEEIIHFDSKTYHSCHTGDNELSDSDFAHFGGELSDSKGVVK